VTKLNEALAGVTRLGFDTPPVIYFIEANSQYDALVTEVFQRVSSGMQGITSVITLTEVLIHPLRRGDVALQKQYSDLLMRIAASCARIHSRLFLLASSKRVASGRASFAASVDATTFEV
jgi:hypothetical protein